MTPEEIERLLYRENVRLASVSKRASAFFLDELLLSLLLVISLWDRFASVQSAQDMILLSQSFTLEYVVLKIVYQTFFVYRYGASLGKIAMRIQVVDLTTLHTPSLGSSLNRAVVRIVSEALFYLGFLWGVFDPFRRTWHDLTAKTIVIES